MVELKGLLVMKDFAWLYVEHSGYFGLYESDVVVSSLRSNAFADHFRELSREHRFVDWHLELIASRFGLEDVEGSERCTLEEAAERYGVTRERVRQIEQRFLAFLKHPKVFERIEDLINLSSLPKRTE